MVEFGTHNHREDSDIVRFDDRAGGRIATGHLLAMGHERIAFLGHHTREPRPTNYFWSVEREVGWMESMRAAGRNTEGLSFLPEVSERWPFEAILSGPEQCALAYEVARDFLLPRRDITAVVAANVIAAEGLYSALAESDIPEADWPAVVCFDDVTSGSRAVITCVRLPWDEIGRTAAQLLWDRNHGQEAAPARQILVPMRLIARLTCRPDKSSHLMIASGSHLLTGALS
jgi:DNA-binding LacI/PurR family transcriptional regulator